MADNSSCESCESGESSSCGSNSEAILECESDCEVDVYHSDGNRTKPYMFEPEVSASNSSDPGSVSSIDEVEGARTTNNEWCHCGFCQRQDTERECVCCRELSKVMDRNMNTCEKRGIETPACMTLNPGFLAVCIDLDVLETAWFAYKQQYGDYDAEEHKRLRHIAYRQFVRWCWGWLGRHIRVVLPACVVSCISTFSTTRFGRRFCIRGVS